MNGKTCVYSANIQKKCNYRSIQYRYTQRHKHGFNEQINDLERTLIPVTPFLRLLRMGKGQDILVNLL